MYLHLALDAYRDRPDSQLIAELQPSEEQLEAWLHHLEEGWKTAGRFLEIPTDEAVFWTRLGNEPPHQFSMEPVAPEGRSRQRSVDGLWLDRTPLGLEVSARDRREDVEWMGPLLSAGTLLRGLIRISTDDTRRGQMLDRLLHDSFGHEHLLEMVEGHELEPDERHRVLQALLASSQPVVRERALALLAERRARPPRTR